LFSTGKSAVVAAIQLCLGVTARTTGRGKSLGALIREGTEGPAKMRVTLLNEGVDAYKPEKYGKRITVERTINNRNGGGGYRLLGEKGDVRLLGYSCGILTLFLEPFTVHIPNLLVPSVPDLVSSFALNVQVVSQEKRELDNILRTFNIYGDNPCCILTQEESKKFIQGHEKDKYEFFLKVSQSVSQPAS
jgi:chromosome segregation ATPase